MQEETEVKPATETEQKKKPNFFSLVISTIGAAFGVQSKKNYERDFKHGNIKVFIAAGIIFTGLFIFTVLTIVNTVLESQSG